MWEATRFGIHMAIIRPSYESRQLKADDGPVSAETCSLPHNKYDVF